MKIYIVWFSTGNCSDRINEIDKVFDSGNKAYAYCKSKNDFLTEHGLNENDCCYMSEKYSYKQHISKIIGHEIDYTGASYNVEGPFDVEE